MDIPALSITSSSAQPSRFTQCTPTAVLSVFLATLFLLTGCSGGGDTDSDRLSGDIQIDGSSTVYPITEGIAEDFMMEYPRVRVTVGVSGTGGGFSKFVRGETDINNASRPIKSVEADLAREYGIEYIELPVAYDGLAVMVHPSNDWVDCLTVSELRRIWEPDSDVDRWSDVRDEFPDQPLELYGRATDSGTYDYFTAAIVGEEGNSRSDYTASVDDNVIVRGIGGDRNSLGFFGLSYYENNRDALKLLGIDDENPGTGEGCVKPTPDTVQSGTYQPLARPEFIYVRADRADAPEIEAFVTFFIDNADRIVREVEYVPLSEEAYRLAQRRYDQRITGSLFQGDGSQIGVRMNELLRRGEEEVEGSRTPAAEGDQASGVDNPL